MTKCRVKFSVANKELSFSHVDKHSLQAAMKLSISDMGYDPNNLEAKPLTYISRHHHWVSQYSLGKAKTADAWWFNGDNDYAARLIVMGNH